MTAGLTPVIIENMYNSDGSFITDLEAMEAAMVEYQDRVLCVLSTTSCFAPRQPDRVDEIGKLCSKHNCGYIINNAYGVQCSTINKLINKLIDEKTLWWKHFFEKMFLKQIVDQKMFWSKNFRMTALQIL